MKLCILTDTMRTMMKLLIFDVYILPFKCKGMNLTLIVASSLHNSVNMWELKRSAVGPIGEECCLILSLYRILSVQEICVFLVVFYVL